MTCTTTLGGNASMSPGERDSSALSNRLTLITTSYARKSRPLSGHEPACGTRNGTDCIWRCPPVRSRALRCGCSHLKIERAYISGGSFIRTRGHLVLVTRTQPSDVAAPANNKEDSGED